MTKVGDTTVPRTPKLGESGARVGTAGATTVKATVLVAPIGVVTLTFLVVRAAPAVIMILALSMLFLSQVFGEEENSQRRDKLKDVLARAVLPVVPR